MSYLSNRCDFVWVYPCIKPAQGIKRVQEEACEAQTDGNKFASFFRVLVNIPLGFIIPGNQ